MYLAENIFDGSVVSAQIGEVYQTETVSGEIKKTQNASVLIENPYVSPINPSWYRIKIKNLTENNANKLIEFGIKLTSVYGAEKEYLFKFFVSSTTGVSTKNLNKIFYKMDGGINSPNNILKYPNYQIDGDMTKIKLEEPQKYNSTFLGWYLDSEFKNEVKEISSSLSGNIVIYAKWQSASTDFLEAEFYIKSVKGYGLTTQTEYTDDTILTYGDSLNIEFKFMPKTENLVGYNYHLKYHYYINGAETNFGKINAESLIVFDNNFPELGAGNYTINLEATMVVGRLFSIPYKSEELKFTVKQKQLTASFNNTEITYDREYHTPDVNLIGVYEEDEGVLAELKELETSNLSVKNVGEYTFIVSGVNNKNYCIAENQTGVMKITEADFHISWTSEKSVVYSGTSFTPAFIKDDTGEDYVGVSLTYYNEHSSNKIDSEDCKNVGKYKVVANIFNKNYKLVSDTEFKFQIAKKQVTIKFNNVEERFTVAGYNRTKISYTISGLVGGDEESVLNIVPTSLGLTSETPGNYPITCTYESLNYEAIIVEGTYKILGYYHVYYKLPNGEIYDELVDEGEQPKGITRDIYKGPVFGKVIYSEKLVAGKGDLFVTVSYKNYTWLVVTLPLATSIVVMYFVLTRKTRRMKNR